jgi:hypothetical protein
MSTAPAWRPALAPPFFALAALLAAISAATANAQGTAPSPAQSAAAVPPAPAAPLTRTTTLGPVTATVTLEPADPAIGDALTLTVAASAEAGIEVLMRAFGEALGRFVILSFAPSERSDGTRTVHEQRYSLDVPGSGEWTVPPLVVEFVDRRPGERPAPEGEDAYELLTESIEFTVRSVLPREAGTELRPPLGPLEPLPTPFERARPWFGGGLLLLAAGIAAAALLVRYGRRRLQRSAYEIALARLRKLQSLPRVTPAEIDRFYVELSAIVRRYLEERFEIRAPECTTEEFLEAASRAPALSAEHRDLLVEFLRRADLVKFARSIPGDLEMAESVRSAERFLEETRADAAPLAAAGAERSRA